MRLTHRIGKKIIIDAGKNCPRDIRKNKNTTGFTIIELLITIGLISYLTYISITYVHKYFYQRKTQILQNRLNHLFTLAQTTALISKKTVSICAYDQALKQCSGNWHNSIIIFYGSNDKNLSKIIYRFDPIINKNENITIKHFSNQPIISFNHQDSSFSSPLNTTIFYDNLYYNFDIKINKIGRLDSNTSSIIIKN